MAQTISRSGSFYSGVAARFAIEIVALSGFQIRFAVTVSVVGSPFFSVPRTWNPPRLKVRSVSLRYINYPKYSTLYSILLFVKI